MRWINGKSMGLSGALIDSVILVFFDSQLVVEKSPKNYLKQLPNCSHCGILIERDVGLGINIKNGAVGH